MADIQSVKTKIQGLIDKANTTTGGSDTDLTTAMDNLIGGYGQGEGLNVDDVIETGLSGDIVSNAKSVRQYGFSGNPVTSIDMPNCETVGRNAIYNCASLTTLNLPKVTSIANNGIANCALLTKGDFPLLKTVGSSFMGGCTKLAELNLPSLETMGSSFLSGTYEYTFPLTLPVIKSIPNSAMSYSGECISELNMPLVESIGDDSLKGCSNLTKLIIPKCKTIGNRCCQGCSSLEIVDTSSLESIEMYAFQTGALYGGKFKVFILRGNTIPTFDTTNNSYKPFYNMNYLRFFVPRDLVESYKADSNWSTYSSKILALEDYTVDGTITGAFDESKITW